MSDVMAEIIPPGGLPDSELLNDIRRLAGDCRAWADGDVDSHPGVSRARRAADRLDAWLAGVGLSPIPGSDVDDARMLADRCGRLYRRLVDARALPAARAVNMAWADLTEVA